MHIAQPADPHSVTVQSGMYRALPNDRVACLRTTLGLVVYPSEPSRSSVRCACTADIRNVTGTTTSDGRWSASTQSCTPQIKTQRSMQHRQPMPRSFLDPEVAARPGAGRCFMITTPRMDPDHGPATAWRRKATAVSHMEHRGLFCRDMPVLLAVDISAGQPVNTLSASEVASRTRRGHPSHVRRRNHSLLYIWRSTSSDVRAGTVW